MVNIKKLGILMITLLLVLMCANAYASPASPDLLSRENMKNLNSQVLECFLSGNESQINNLPEVKAFKAAVQTDERVKEQFAASISAMNKISQPVREIKNIMINGAKNDISIFDDGSFIVCSMSGIKDNESALMQTMGSEEVYYNEFEGNGNYTIVAQKKVYSGYLVELAKLTANVNNNTSSIHINSASSSGSKCYYPRVLRSHSASIQSNDSSTVMAQGDYLVEVDIVAFPLETESQSIELWMSKYSDTGFSATGNFIN